MRTAVEGVDAPRISEAHAPKHLLDASGLRALLADDLLRLNGQERRVDGSFGKEALDKLLVLLRETIGFRVRHPGELPAERVPQMRRSVGLERRQQLREELVLEPLAVHPDEEKPHVRDDEAQPLGLLAILRAPDEPPDFRRPVEGVANLEHHVAEMPVERRRVALFLGNVDVDVGCVAPAELPDDYRRADDAVALEVDENEDVLATARVLDRAGEACLRVLQDSTDLVAIRGQVHRVQVAGDMQQLILVGEDGAADLEGPEHWRAAISR